MAKPIKAIKPMELSPEEKKQQDLEEIQDALVENKDSILETIKLFNNLHTSGATSMVNGLLSEGDKVLDIIVKEASKPENTNTLKNLLLMIGTLGTINVKELEPILLKVNTGIERVAHHSDSEAKTSTMSLLKAMRDPEINRAVTLMLTFLRGMGEETESMERNR
ncbi:DUF1641 domain-containing protein [Bacillus sp. FJAT-44742]|uniref:DUF1641 domain-containing protein n=1 Tax=Bacillus sp. FJAT-44742 TaxID=2014005 RepID=UPI000C24EDAE|nr:DUF1641 domain-containing protein [Bacillus sp. FJAT-44742]